jgi:nitroreductase
MKQNQIRYLLALSSEQDWAKAAQTCGIPEQELVKTLKAAEVEYGYALFKPGTQFGGFTAEGQEVIAQAHALSCALEALEQCFRYGQRKHAVASLLERRSVSPKRLCEPAPDTEAIELMIAAAMSAPDNGGLHPWRTIMFPPELREFLASVFEREKLRRDPLASDKDLQRAREHATRSPALLAFVISPNVRTRVPEREQLLAAGAALGNFLNAAHQLGYGAIALSGERTFDATFCSELGLEANEHLACFICLGSISKAAPARKITPPSTRLSTWVPCHASVLARQLT